MALPVIIGTVRIAVIGHTSLGTPWVNVIHVRRTAGVVSNADFPGLVTELNRLYGGASYGGGGLNLLSSCNASTGVDRYVFIHLDGTSASVPLTAAAAGAGAVGSCPSEVAMVMTLRTALRGRRNRGRIYLPAPTTTNINADGTLAAGILTGFPAQMVGWNTAIGVLNYTLVVASYVGVVVNTVTSVTMDKYADVQRRRKA